MMELLIYVQFALVVLLKIQLKLSAEQLHDCAVAFRLIQPADSIFSNTREEGMHPQE